MMIVSVNLVVAIAIALLAGAAPIPRSPITKRDDNPKLVVAHHMVGNVYNYTIDTWTQDITLAHNNGIDAFALNVGTNDWEPDQVDNAYQAAKNFGTGFMLFISFDLSVMPCASPQDASPLRDYITRYATHPNQLKYNNKVFASTFDGDRCTFGSDTSPDGWKSQFIDQLTGDNEPYFVPAFFANPDEFGAFDGVIDGIYSWNSGWPSTLTTEDATTLIKPLGGTLATNLNSSVLADLVGSIKPDNVYLDGLKNMQGNTKTYMAAVSPCFFTHYGPDSLDKNYIYMYNEHLYNKRWETIISNRDSINIVEIVTWNDYGESHYIGPIEGQQPNSQDWVDGFDHTAWLDMTLYYATAFKTGSFPDVTQDKIYLSSRPHPRDATASSDSLPRPDNYQLLMDIVEAVIMATSPSQVTLSNGPSNQTFDVPAGVSKLSIPIAAGGTMYGKIERDGNTIVELDPEFTFNATPSTYNFNSVIFFAAGGENQPNNSSVTESPTDNSSSTVISSSSISNLPLATPSPSPSPSPSSSSSPPSLSPSPSSLSSSPPPSSSSPPPSSSSSSPPSSSPPSPSPSSSGDPESSTTPGPSPSITLSLENNGLSC